MIGAVHLRVEIGTVAPGRPPGLVVLAVPRGAYYASDGPRLEVPLRRLFGTRLTGFADGARTWTAVTPAKRLETSLAVI